MSLEVEMKTNAEIKELPLGMPNLPSPYQNMFPVNSQACNINSYKAEILALYRLGLP